MTTKLYFHNASNALAGTFPTGEQATATPSWSVTGATTLRTADTTIGVSQTSLAGNSLASTSAQDAFLGFFCSLALSGAQTVGGSTNTRTINIANAESNTNMNFGLGLEFNEYVWRPGTGAVVGVVRDASGTASSGGVEPSAASSEQVNHVPGWSLTGGGVAAQDGDVIIIEVWSNHTQGMATSYTGTFYFDGTTENTTNNAVVSNQASFYLLSETLTFKGAATTAVGASSGTGAATGVGASAVNQPGSSAGVGAATGVGRSTAASVGSASGVGAASAVGTGINSAVGSSAGTGAAAGTGASAAKSPGSAAGIGAASGVGASTAASVGASAGVGAATATGASTARAVGSAAGTSTASGIAPAATSDAVGSASGIGAASGVGRSTAASIGSGSGTGTATGIGASAANAVGSSAGTGIALGVAAVASNVGSASGTSSASGVGASLVQAVGSAAGSATVTAIGTSTGGATIEYLGGMPDRYAHLDYSRRAHREVQETKRLSKTQAKKRIKEAYRLVSIRAMPDSELVEALRPYSPRAAAALLPPAESVAFSKLVDDTEALRLIYLAYYEALDEEETEILLLAS